MPLSGGNVPPNTFNIRWKHFSAALQTKITLVLALVSPPLSLTLTKLSALSYVVDLRAYNAKLYQPNTEKYQKMY